MNKNKYRAWLKTEKRMVEPYAITSLGTPGEFITELRGDLYTYNDKSEYELMQSTGREDVNGVEIYERDVVNIANLYGHINFGKPKSYEIFMVRYELFGYFPFYKPDDIDCNFVFDHEDVVVLGNVYENPELLD